MKSEYQVLISLAIIISSVVGTTVFDNLTTTSYSQCRSGGTYGTWESTATDYVFKCDLTEVFQVCWRTTKTRCYLFDLDKVSELGLTEVPSVTSLSRESVVCDWQKCT